MGYCMTTMKSTATLPVENIPAAVEALKELDKTGMKTGCTWIGGEDEKTLESHFAFVASGWADSGDIVEMLRAWRYETYWDEYGNLVVDWFFGDKYGDDDQLWAALSPDMRGHIDMRGEDGEMWRWELGGPLKTLEGRVTFREND